MSSLTIQQTLMGKSLFTSGESFSIGDAAHAMGVTTSYATSVLKDMKRAGQLDRTQTKPNRYKKPSGSKALLSRLWV